MSIGTDEHNARMWVQDLLDAHFGLSSDPTKRQELARTIVAEMGKRLLPVVEGTLRSSMVYQSQVQEQIRRERNSGIAEYCREFRLDVQGMLDANPDFPPRDLATGMVLCMRLDEERHRRLAKEG